MLLKTSVCNPTLRGSRLRACARLVVVVLAAGCAGSDGTSSPGDPPDARAGIGPPVDAPDDATSAVDAGLDAPACAAATWAPGTHEVVALAHDGRDRSYVLHVGTGVDPDQPVPLLLNFHGYTNNPDLQASFSRMNALADSEGFVVVYPRGVDSSFNAGSCCGTASRENVDDVGFTRAIVADVAAHLCLDRGRVYATGFSNGGFMSHRLACEASDLVAAIAPVAAANVTASCTPSRPVPVIAFHGDGDTVVSLADGTAAVAAWVTRNRCTGGPTRTPHGASRCERWATCAGGAAVELCTIAGGRHLWPGATADYPASPAIWAFLRGYRL